MPFVTVINAEDRLWLMSDDTQEFTQVAIGGVPLNNLGGTVGVEFQDSILFHAAGMLYRTDGTIAGSTMLSSVNPNLNELYATNRYAVTDTHVYFKGFDYDTGTELWRTDGTTTELVRDLMPDTASGAPTGFVTLGDRVVFSATTPDYRGELFSTDGTAGGTSLVKDITPGTSTSNITFFTNEAHGGRVIFQATTAAAGRELWITDGTEAGTNMVADINPFGDSTPGGPTVYMDGFWYFVAAGNGTGRELWRSNGTEDGTELVRDILEGGNDASITDMVVADGQIFLNAQGTRFDSELWVSDGTTEGTRLVTSLNAGDDEVRNLAAFGDRVLFVANDGTHGDELWISDGTEAGTMRISDINPGILSADPDGFYVLGDRAFFTATGPAGTGRELYSTDGTLEGTGLVNDFRPGSVNSHATVLGTIEVGSSAPQITLSSDTIAEGNAADDVVATISSPLTGATFGIYSNPDNMFSVQGTQLIATQPFDFETASSHQVTLRAVDDSGSTVLRNFTITVTDVAEPILGTPGDDRLTGTSEADNIQGLDGTDTLIGQDGDDTLIGGTSEDDLRDVIYGGSGNDILDGGYGNDQLRGDDGNDTITGGFGVDEIFGGTDDDVLTGQAWSDLIFGGAGDDFINGGFGFDRVNGGADADRFFHLGVADHGSDWIQDYSSDDDGDVLVFGGTATRDQFQVNFTETANAGDAGVEEAFVIYRPTGQILWALVDGAAQEEINLVIAGTEYDLLS